MLFSNFFFCLKTIIANKIIAYNLMSPKKIYFVCVFFMFDLSFNE